MPRSFTVGVLDTQHKLATVAARKQVAKQGRAGPAHVQVTRRAGGKSGTNHDCGLVLYQQKRDAMIAAFSAQYCCNIMLTEYQPLP